MPSRPRSPTERTLLVATAALSAAVSVYLAASAAGVGGPGSSQGLRVAGAMLFGAHAATAAIVARRGRRTRLGARGGGGNGDGGGAA